MHKLFRSKHWFWLLTVVLLTSACRRLDTRQPEVGPTSEQSATPSEPPKQLVILNSGDVAYLDKLLLQRERATEAHKKDAAEWLQASREMAAEDRASGYAKGYEGLPKVHCPSAMTYPTNEALIACAESFLQPGITSDSRAYYFEEAKNIYQATEAFSEAVGEPLSQEQNRSIETNKLCLDQYFANLEATQFGCVMIFSH